MHDQTQTLAILVCWVTNIHMLIIFESVTEGTSYAKQEQQIWLKLFIWQP